VDAAIDRVLDGGRASASEPGGGDLSGRRVAIFTSGGVIGRTLQRVLGAPDQTALALNWRIRNASLTHLTFSGRRVSLDSFNVTTHLRSTGLDSYR
jgi:broad specificity phosphatase PhoE